MPSVRALSMCLVSPKSMTCRAGFRGSGADGSRLGIEAHESLWGQHRSWHFCAA